ncbi:MAG: tRNA (adenosine(37)-N6)-threonylcarbamoyltransferase complex dimerization subunit type 1 TsaB [Myxococcota bacterium]
MADRLGGLRALADREPLLLALCTAAGPGSAALLRGETTLARRVAADARHHAADVIELVDGVLGDAGHGLADVEVFALAIGPGSFTRLRVGLATVKGLAFGSARRAAPVSTLAAMAEAARVHVGPGRPVAPALDARRGQLYAALYAPVGEPAADGEAAPDWEARVPEGVYGVEEWLARLPAEAVVVGEGAALCEGGPVECRADWGAPAADAVGRLGARMAARGEAVSPDALVPRYLRRAEAESLRLGLARPPA